MGGEGASFGLEGRSAAGRRTAGALAELEESSRRSVKEDARDEARVLVDVDGEWVW